MNLRVNKRVLYTVLSALVILVGTAVAVEYAKGNLRVSREGFQQGTGLLAANSFPPGAEVYINGKLTTATDDTLYIDPGTYTVEIKKDGFATWKKDLIIQRELVTQTNAKLFPVSPSLTALTYTGVENVSPSPDGQKLVYYNASASAQAKNGLYVLALNNNLINFQASEAKQISTDDQSMKLNTAEFIWSPDSSQVLVISENRQILLDVDQMNNLETTQDVTLRSKQILSEWEEEMYLREKEYLVRFPPEVVALATQSAQNVYISPDKKRLLYTATAELTIPENLVPPPPIINTQPQDRNLVPNGIYVYDREEDTNFKVGVAKTETNENVKKLLSTLGINTPASTSAFQTLQATTSAQTAENFNRYHTSLYTDTLQWHPDSKHLLYAQDSTLNVMTYDGTNQTVLYAGPFSLGFFYPWPDGKRLIIQTMFALNAPVNLYAIELNN